MTPQTNTPQDGGDEWLDEIFAHLQAGPLMPGYNDAAMLNDRRLAKLSIVAELRAREREAEVNMATHIMSAKTEGLIDAGELFIKRAPVERAIVDRIGVEAFKAIQQELPSVQAPQPKEQP